ncbi:MAG TPA: TatD family hydrolase [Halomonas sp.]|nr:TatD family hydrolase [Halomonas sp.]
MADSPADIDDYLPEALRFRSPAPLVDIGANLTHASFATDLEATLARARAAGVETLIVTGTDLAHAEQALALSQRHPGLYATAGVHPHDASGWTAELASAMAELHRQPGVVAVGECGLDFNRNFSTPAEQERAFELAITRARR